VTTAAPLPTAPRSKDCETLAQELQAAGLAACHYHADMDPAAREAAHVA
jgi:superfamily II DNA helicase RecQ